MLNCTIVPDSHIVYEELCSRHEYPLSMTPQKDPLFTPKPEQIFKRDRILSLAQLSAVELDQLFLQTFLVVHEWAFGKFHYGVYRCYR